MTCPSCSGRIEKRLAGLAGVTSASVNLATEIAHVEYDSSLIDLSEMIKAVQDLGYGARERKEESMDKAADARKKEMRKLCLLFVFSAILSFPLLLAMIFMPSENRISII